MSEIRNQAQLQKAIQAQAQLAIENSTNEILEIFKRDYIDKIAYIKSPAQYERTYEFKNAWEWSEMKIMARNISTYLWYDADKMTTFEPDKFIHGSKYSSPNDVRETLPAILEGKQSSLWLSVSREGKFWQEFLKEMFDNGKLDEILTRNFKKMGFTKA